MDWNLVKPLAAQAARDFLRTVGMYLAAKGIIQGDAGVATFIGAGMSLAGLFWGWFTTSGYLKLAGLLKKLTATHTPADAVKAAQVLPPAAAVDTALNKAAVKSVVGTVATILLVAFVLSAFLAAPSAQAQTRRPALQITGDVVKDTKANFGLTGNASGDMQALWQKIVGSSLNDLNYAAAMASSANTSSSAVRLQCIKAIITLNEQASGVNLKNSDGTPMAKPDPHAFTDVESLAEIVDNLAPQGPLFVNCAGAAQLAKTNVLSFVNALVTGAAGLAAMPVIPGL